MQKKRITLVLGAGASHPYQMPLALELVHRVVESLSQGYDTFNLLRQIGYPEHQLTALGESLLLSNVPSVDFFLEAHETFRKSGKAAIAFEISKYEREQYLVRNRERKWFEILWRFLATPKLGDFPTIDLSVITFNYDRSFEMLMCLAIQHMYQVPEEEALRVLKSVPIIHVYGSLGSIDRSDLGLYLPYSPSASPDQIHAASSRIFIVGESKEPPDSFGLARRLIEDADFVLFLGFGYHKVNVRRLGFPTQPPKGGVLGTAMGLNTLDCREVVKAFENGIHLRDMPCEEFLQSLECLRDL